MTTWVIASSSCTPLPPPAPATPTGGLSGNVRVIARPGADTILGPVVVTAAAVGTERTLAHAPRRVRIVSSTDLFDPSFATAAAGDSVVFVNRGALSHRLFSADLAEEVQVPIRPASSSAPIRIEGRGQVRFFCSLHAEETFEVLVTAAAPSGQTDHNGWYDIWPLADGAYQLSIWSRRVSGPVRVVEVVSGRLSIEPIWIDPDLIR